MPKKRKGPPPQVLIIFAFVLVLMGISAYSVFSSSFQEEHKARQTARYFLEALGRVPPKDLGKHLYGEVRHSYTPQSFAQRLHELGLDQPLEIVQWQESRRSSDLPQWRWRVQVKQGQKTFPLLVYVRLPQQMSLSRRWETYTFCRPQQDLEAQLAPLFAAGLEAPVGAESDPQWQRLKAALKAKGFVGNLPGQLVGFDADGESLQYRLPGRDGRVLNLDWQVQPGPQLNCDYTLRHFALVGPEREKPPSEVQSRYNRQEKAKSEGDGL